MHWCNVQLESSPFTLGPECPVNKGDAPWGTQRDPQLFERSRGPFTCVSPLGGHSQPKAREALSYRL